MEKKITIKPRILAIVLTVLAAGYGCADDFFNQKAGDRITPDQHYNTLVDAGVSLQGAIIPLQDVMPELIMLDGLMSDMMDVTPNADAYLHQINDHRILEGNPFIDPSDLYKVILNVNEVLVHIDKIYERDRNFDLLTISAYKGALISMRAWTYLTLARLYGKTVYLGNNLPELPANLTQHIMTKQEIIDTLINQLIPYIQAVSTGTQYEELRLPHVVNTKALLGELYLEKNDYANAATYLKLACESYLNQSALLKVDKTYRDAAWSSIFLNAEGNDVENLSVIPYSSENDQDNPLAYWVGRNYLYLVKPSAVLVDSFLTQIPAAGNPGDLWRGRGVTFGIDTLGMLNDTTYLTEAYITKYQIDQQDPLSSDIILSRAADVHLLLAEALNRLGDVTNQGYAKMLLNDGVNKVNPKPAAYAKWSANLGVRGRVYLKAKEVGRTNSAEETMLVIENQIMDERALELAFEGKRWFDLVRIAERRQDPAYLADRVAAKFAGTPKYEEIRTKLMNPENWYLPFE